MTLDPFSFEDLRQGVDRVRAQLQARLAGLDVLLVEAAHDESDPPRTPEPEIVFADGQGSRRTTGLPLLITGRCADPEAWSRIDQALGAEGFERFGPMSVVGAQCYRSRRRATIIVEAHPGAELPVDRTGRPILTTIS